MILTTYSKGIAHSRVILKNIIHHNYGQGSMCLTVNFCKNLGRLAKPFGHVERHMHKSNKNWNAYSKCSLNNIGLTPQKSRPYLLANSCHWQQVRTFRVTSPQKAIPPVIWLLVKPAAKLVSVLTGRSLRKVWQKMPDAEKKEVRKLITKGRVAAAIAFLCALVGIDYVTHLQQTPITHRKRYLALTSDQLNKIIDFELKTHFNDLAPKVIEPTHPAYQYVIKVAQRIITANQDLDFFKNQQWTLVLVDDDAENAFVLPTGHIFVHSGLLNVMANEDELAVVLGHEMSHALLQHAAERLSFAQFIDIIVIFSMAALWFFMPTDGIAVVTHWFYDKIINLMLHLPYSRKLEVEADDVGLQLIAKACYDVRASSVFWDKMYLMSTSETGSAEVPELLSTHPGHEKRAETLDTLIPGAIALMKQCNCPPLPSEDPRKDMQEKKKYVEESKEAGIPVKLYLEKPDGSRQLYRSKESG